MRSRWIFLLLSACGGTVDSTDASFDAAPAMADAGADAYRLRTHEVVPAPGPFVAGIAEVQIPAPLGIGTMGFGALNVQPSVTPFASGFPGTTRAYGSLMLRAVALSRGPSHELVLVRMDTVGVFQQLREAVLDELERRIGRRLDDSLILAGNHTHSGPGRLLMTTGSLTLLADQFFPEFYDRLIGALADVIEQAIADEAPAELATTLVDTSIGHMDRRCENDPLAQLQESPDMPLVAVRRAGRLDALILSYAYHGTVLGIEEHTLSGDFGAIVEQKIEEHFDHPVLVLFFNSWGADMAPGDHPVDPGATGADLPAGYERMHVTGDAVASVVVPALDSLSFAAEPELRTRTYRARIDRQVIGYPQSEFPYPFGGAFCGLGADGNCTSIMHVAGLDHACIGIGINDHLPEQTMLSAGEIGDIHFVTAPGEWSTALAAGVLDHLRARAPGTAMLIGYANDYTGYSLGVEDWWQGGYEASGALWGPSQGDYLAARAIDTFDTFFDEWNEAPYEEPARVPPFSGYTYTPYVPEGAQSLGMIASDVPATVAATDVVTFTVLGSDPWLGLPVATLEHADGTAVLRGDASEVSSRSYDFWIDLTTTPTYSDVARADQRAFAWTFSYPISCRAFSNIAPLAGSYRFRIEIPAAGATSVVHSGTFSVE